MKAFFHDMAKATGRALAVIEILQAETRISGTELARRLGVDRRTVRRDIAHLAGIGIPVEALRGRDGGYAIRAGQKLPPMMLTSDEALAVAVGLQAARRIGISGIESAAAGVQAKLERVLPKTTRRHLREVEQTVAMDLASPVAVGKTEILTTLSAAARGQQRVRLRYRSQAGNASERDLDPYGIGYRAGAWYAVGYCHLRRELRSFRLDRIVSASPKPASFKRPNNFNILKYLSTAIARLPRAFSVEVMLHADLKAASRALQPEIAQLESVEGGVLMRAQVSDLKWMAREMARLPLRFTVIKPAALVRSLQSHVEHLADQLASSRQASRHSAPGDHSRPG